MGLIEFLLAVYVIFVLLAIVGWQSKNQAQSTHNLPFVSVVIPFRNEADNLQATLQSVYENKNASFEILLINDHSEDNSLEICKQFIAQHSNIKVLSLEDTHGKKEALKKGVNASKGNWILQTDADCTVSSTWISTMASYAQKEVNLIMGPVKCKEEMLPWNWFNQIEIAFLQGITGATAKFNNPVMANGANLLFRKDIFEEYLKSGMGEKYASGDDQFLLNFVKKSEAQSIKYVQKKAAIVESSFPFSWEQMLIQRTRWAKKNMGTWNQESIVGLVLLSTQLLWPFLLVVALINPLYWTIAWKVFWVKTVMEFFWSLLIFPFFKIKRWGYLPLYAIIYPVFLIQVLLRTKTKDHRWKGRNID